MKRLQRFRIFPGIAVTILSIFMFSACEPKDWHYILASPEPLTDLNIVGSTANVESISLSVTFHTPNFAILQIHPDSYPFAVFFIRPEGTGTDENITLSSSSGNIAAVNAEVGTVVDVPKTLLVNGGSYILACVAQDAEGQFSTPTESAPFVISW